MSELSTAPEGWEHATRDLPDGTTIQHGDAVLVEATYTQSDRAPGKTLDTPPGPQQKLWLNVQGHAPVMAPLDTVHAPLKGIARAIHESGDELEVTVCTLTEDEIDAALLSVGELYETLLRRRAELQRELAL